MAVIANRRSVMTLFSSPLACHSHRARLVLAEKGVNAEIFDVDPMSPPEDLLQVSPYGALPTLVDRELELYDSRVIVEYLDERFPHPPLMPVDPVNRARFRLTLTRIETEWYGLLERIEGRSKDEAERAKTELREDLIANAQVFSARAYFMSEDFSLVDCSVLPLLWRLPHFGIALPPEAAPVLAYGERLFRRPSFRQSLSRQERDMRP